MCYIILMLINNLWSKNMSNYAVTVDTTYTNTYYIEAESQEKAEKIAEENAWNNHHGESIINVSIADTTEEEKPEYPEDYTKTGLYEG